VDQSGDSPIAICIVESPKGALFEGRGTNKKIAKADACRKAMKAEKNQEDISRESKNMTNDYFS